MKYNFDYTRNIHSTEGAKASLRVIFEGSVPSSLLDVGCGVGAWLRAAQELGVRDVLGIDGARIDSKLLLVTPDLIKFQNFECGWSLQRKFDVILCLEVAEHVDVCYVDQLISSLVSHSDTIVFSAACPGQPGQKHIHCEWPSYWQAIFNRYGYSCDDRKRWQLWCDDRVEPWYRQNLFVARRDPKFAGQEERLVSVVHPSLLPFMLDDERARISREYAEKLMSGELPSRWYLKSFYNTWRRLICRNR